MVIPKVVTYSDRLNRPDLILPLIMHFRQFVKLPCCNNRKSIVIDSPLSDEDQMPIKRTALLVLIAVSVVGVILWVGLDAVMRGVTEMEKNMGGARQVVKDDRMNTRDD
jgi:hypothetical protein